MANDSDGPHGLQASLVAAVSFLLFVAGAALLGRGVWAAYDGNIQLATLCIGSGLVLLLAATLERFESLKGLGLEAKMRALTTTIDKAEEQVRTLREVLELIGPMLIALNARAGRWDSAPTVEEFYDQSRTIKRAFEVVRARKDVADAALKQWVGTMAFDAAARVIHNLQVRLQAKAQHDALIKVQTAANKAFERGARPETPRQAIELLHSFASLDFGLGHDEKSELQAQAAHWAGEIEYLEEHLDFRDKAAWFAFLKR
jgi:hypothetical protein